jgi:hypothetical protein
MLRSSSLSPSSGCHLGYPKKDSNFRKPRARTLADAIWVMNPFLIEVLHPFFNYLPHPFFTEVWAMFSLPLGLP